MKLKSLSKALFSLALVTSLVACGNSSSDNNDVAFVPNNNGPAVAPAGVYTLTNTGISNSIRQYRREAGNVLTFIDDFPTGGNGDATDLPGTVGALNFQPGSNRFYAVNPGSNTISAMILGTDSSISILSTVTSNGARPVSIASYGDLVYVLNYGNPGLGIPANISGYRLQGAQLLPIPDSTQVLSSDYPEPCQIGFHPTGTVLVVTESGTDNIITFQVDSNGKAVPGVSQGSNGNTPGGFKFTSGGLLVVSEGNDGAAGSGTTSVYNVGVAGGLVDLTVSKGNGQTGTSSVEILSNVLVYTGNIGSNNLSAYSLDGAGSLSLIGAGIAETTDASPSSTAASLDNLNLYTLNSVANTISTYTIGSDGSLNEVNLPIATPSNAVGLIAR